MLSVIWAIGGILIFVMFLVLVAWANGKGELASHEVEEFVIAGAMCGAVWPLIVVAAIAVAPFYALYRGVKHIAEKRG